MKKILSVLSVLMVLASCGGGYNPPELPDPVASFSYKTRHTFIVSFTNGSLYATSYVWDFGDGFTSTDENPTHAYSGKGVYKITLTASNNGKQSKISKNVTITEPTKCSVVGFDIYKIPTYNEYYRLRFTDADLIFVSSDYTTSWYLLSSANIPFEIKLKTPNDIDFTEDEYYLRLYMNSNTSGDGSVVDKWSIYTKDLKKNYNEKINCFGDNSFVSVKLNWKD